MLLLLVLFQTLLCKTLALQGEGFRIYLNETKPDLLCTHYSTLATNLHVVQDLNI